MTVEGRASIYHMNSNAWGPLKWTPESSFPPLLDRRVIPGALERRFVAGITFGGTQAPLLREIIRKDLPMDPKLFIRPDRGPRFEWYGTLESGSKKRLADAETLSYVNFIRNLVFDELAGNRSILSREFQDPVLTVILEYDGNAKDVLELGVRKGQDRYYLSNATTGQVFLMSAEKAAALTPDCESLLKEPGGPVTKPATRK